MSSFVATVAAAGALVSCGPDVREYIEGLDMLKPDTATTQVAAGGALSPEEAAATLSNGVSMNEAGARLTLQALPIAAPASMADYDREARFGGWLAPLKWGWSEAPDADGCTVREATLLRDGSAVAFDPDSCVPVAGTWTDPYTAETFTDPSEIEIDHTVPVANAWRSGANDWTDEQRKIYYNSPLVTVISSGSVNGAKGDKGPEVWQPQSEAAWCNYSIRWIAVKSEFGLNLTSQSEKDWLSTMLGTCPASTP